MLLNRILVKSNYCVYYIYNSEVMALFHLKQFRMWKYLWSPIIFLSLYKLFWFTGRYNKYSRELSQTPWICDGKRKGESSVEEEICNPLKKIFKFEGNIVIWNLFKKLQHLSVQPEFWHGIFLTIKHWSAFLLKRICYIGKIKSFVWFQTRNSLPREEKMLMFECLVQVCLHITTLEWIMVHKLGQ